MWVELNPKDKEILEWLQKDGKLTVQQISKKTGIPATTVHNRIKHMEESGIIKGYSVHVDRYKLGTPLSVFVLVTIQYDHSHGKKFSQKEVAEKVRQLKEVEYVSILTGQADMMIKANLEDTRALDTFLLDKLRNMDGIHKTETLVILSEF